MKTNHSHQKPFEKPIKYKQFIQQIQNSSRSSNNDQSLLSQRSFRQSYTARDFHQQFNNQTNKKTCEKDSPFKLNVQQTSYRIANPSSIQNEHKGSDPNDKLYTFCDAKLTERSIEIVNNSNSKNKTNQTQAKTSLKSTRYFKTNKQRNEQKENIDFVNQILQKVQSGGFQGNVLKTQNSQLQNLQKSTKKNPQPIQLMKKQSINSNLLTQSSSHRKIQSVKKIFVLSKQPINRVSNTKITVQNNMSEQKSRENSLRKNHEKTQPQKQSHQKCSSKKKVVSLNINPLKNSINNPSNVRLKLSLDKSYDKHNQQKSFNLENRGSLVQTKMLSSSLEKMPSLDQSKIQSTHNEGSKCNLLMSGTQLSQLTNFFIKQPHKNQQIQRLQKIVDEQKQKQKKLGKQIYELNQKLKHFSNGQDKREVEILQKDCARLTNSYKEIKKLYELAIKEKEEVQMQMQNLIGQNNDLQECLKFRSHEVNELKNKAYEMNDKIQELQHQLENRAFPSQLSGLSDMIKQKLSQYENEISSLLDENNKLTLLREKLQNYNQTLKEEIEQKDSIIESLQMHLKQSSNLRRSCRDEIGDYRHNELRLNKLCKQLQSKLKLSNIHNEYLTKQIVGLKQQKKQLITSNITSGNTSLLMAGNSPKEKSKFSNFNTLANTITTRNSSISHVKDNFDHFLHRLNKEKQSDQEIYSSSEHIL